jgi:virulence factor Mce-like protein
MIKERPSIGALAGIVVFTLSCFLLLLFLWRSFGGTVPLTPEGYRVSALYKEAVLVPVEADVRISGVNVGSVKSVEREGSLSRITMEIDEPFAPLASDTKTIVRRKTLVGEAYLELTPGTAPSRGGSWLPEGATLPLAHAKPTVELDEFLRAFDARTRSNLQTVFKEFALATGDVGYDLNAAAARLEPTFSDAGQLAAILNDQRGDFRGLIRDSGLVLDAFSAQPGQLRALIENANAIFETTARQHRALTEGVRIFPRFLAELNPTLELARDVGLEVDPLLDESRPAVNNLPAFLRNLRAAAPDVEGLADDLDNLLDSTRAGVPALSRTLAAAAPFADQLDPALRDLVPAIHYIARNKLDVITGFAKSGAATQATAGSGPDDQVHQLRAILGLKPEGLGLYDEKLPSNRHNAYTRPGALRDLGAPHLMAFDCLNAGESEFPAPECEQQPDFDFLGRSSEFPQLHREP